ncbi:hypothetical protein BRC68_17970 [Halobacteriales archaeon QH_6_64_20]|jgi:hypothetical protein|nr:MAG: hypothetical protein BRC68_17970 [Halobacteriales archaeon QH_6_64_20]
MSLSEEARERLADVVALQPTKNGELQDRWNLESGKQVHGYLEAELAEYYYRDESSLIRATPEAAELVGAPTGKDGRTALQLPDLQRRALAALPGPDEKSESVVSVLHAIREGTDTDLGPGSDSESGSDSTSTSNTGSDSDAGKGSDENNADDDLDADSVRSALRSLERKGVVEVVRRTVPTFRLAIARDSIEVEPLE